MTTGTMAILVSLMLTGKSGMVTNYDYSMTTNGKVMGFVNNTEFTETLLPTEFKNDKVVYAVYNVVTSGNDKYMYEVYEHSFGGIMVAWGTEKGESHNMFMQGGDYSIKG